MVYKIGDFKIDNPCTMYAADFTVQYKIPILDGVSPLTEVKVFPGVTRRLSIQNKSSHLLVWIPCDQQIPCPVDVRTFKERMFKDRNMWRVLEGAQQCVRDIEVESPFELICTKTLLPCYVMIQIMTTTCFLDYPCKKHYCNPLLLSTSRPARLQEICKEAMPSSTCVYDDIYKVVMDHLNQLKTEQYIDVMDHLDVNTVEKFTREMDKLLSRYPHASLEVIVSKFYRNLKDKE